MDKDPVKKFLGEFGNDNVPDPFENNEQDPFAIEQDGEEPIVEPELKEEKRLPYSKDPKVQKYVQKEIQRAMKDFQPQEIERTIKKDEDVTSVVEAFTAIIGNDTPDKQKALASLEKALGNVDQRASQKAVEQLNEIRQQELKEDREAEEALEDAFDEIEENYDVDLTSNNAIAKKTRSDFVTYVERIAPKDRHGDITEYPDMNAAWETFSELRKGSQTPSRAKELASRSMTRSSEAQVTAPQKRVTFEDADNFIDTL
jgi:hypothetical protein